MLERHPVTGKEENLTKSAGTNNAVNFSGKEDEICSAR
jgi:hypothetical protein